MNIINKWKDKVTSYVDVRMQLAKLNVVDKTSSVLGYLILTFILLFLVLAVLIFLGIALRDVFTQVTESPIAGSFITFGFYVLLLVVVMLARKQISNSFAGIFIRMLTDPGEDHDEKEHGENVTVK